MIESQERFLRVAAERLPVDRVVEIHLFAPIRQGGYETGIAVVAARPAPAAVADAGAAAPGESLAGASSGAGPDESLATVQAEARADTMASDVRPAGDGGNVDEAASAASAGAPAPEFAESDVHGDLTEDAAGGPPPIEMSRAEGDDALPDDRASEPNDAETSAAPGGPPPIPVSHAGDGGAPPSERASDREAAPGEGRSAPAEDSLDPELVALGVGEAAALEADFADPTGAPATVADSSARHTVYTARYRLAVKGPERGRFEVDVQEEADAPMLTIDLVVRGVQRRHDDSAEPERLPGDRLREIVAKVPLPPQQKTVGKPVKAGAKATQKAAAKK